MTYFNAAIRQFDFSLACRQQGKERNVLPIKPDHSIAEVITNSKPTAKKKMYVRKVIQMYSLQLQ